MVNCSGVYFSLEKLKVERESVEHFLMICMW